MGLVGKMSKRKPGSILSDPQFSMYRHERTSISKLHNFAMLVTSSLYAVCKTRITGKQSRSVTLKRCVSCTYAVCCLGTAVYLQLATYCAHKLELDSRRLDNTFNSAHLTGIVVILDRIFSKSLFCTNRLLHKRGSAYYSQIITL
jgi:hypothetical protein